MKKSLLALCLALAGFALFSGRILQSLQGGPAQDVSVAKARSVASGSALSASAGVPGDPTQTNAPAVPAGPARQQRPWDPAFFDRLHDNSPGQPIEFELVGSHASGVIKHIERANGQVMYVSGDLTAPEPGRFFFQKQTEPGKAGKFVGVVEFPGSKTGYRVEPSGGSGESVLVRLPLEQVICLTMPAVDSARLAAEEIPPLDPSDFPDYPIPDYQDGIIPLQSLPGSTSVLYIDYRGGYTPTWGGIAYERPSVSNAQIRDVWKRVAEDYMPFNVNVTTDIQVYQNAPETTRQRVVCTPTTTAAPGAGGVAYLNSWNWSGDTPCWSFYSTGKNAAEVISHEAGHTLQLGHDGRTSPSEGYYGGHGSGAVGWAPIMGVGYYQPVAQWSKGEYLSANNNQDDLAIIVGNNNNVDYRPDDTGAILATSRYLEVFPNGSAQGEGVIGTTGDTDAFQFTTTGGSLALRANSVGDWGNLAMSATLCNSSDVVIASNNPQTTLYAVISTSVSAGTYTFRVTGAGRNSPLTNGFSSYGSLGYYYISGTVANARQSDRFAIPENSPAGTLVGVIPANNPAGGPLSYVITGGNSNSAFSVDNIGQLRVNNATALNYETLGANTQFPVQFELFVNINNLTNSALNEVKRRVLVAITDVNEAPATANLNLSVLEHTQPGTLLGKVTGADPDFYNLLNFAIVSGDTNEMFSIGAQSGELRVVGDLNRSVQSLYQLRVAVSDNIGPVPMSGTSVVSVTVLANTTPFRPGGLKYALYENISGTLVSALTASPAFPADPSSEKTMTSFEGDTDRGDNYGSAMRGYLIPPANGSYTFWIASDDNSELRISTTTNPASATTIAAVNGSGSWTNPREWNKFTSQRSSARSLIAGQAYYIEARQKEGSGGDNLAVAWTGPGLPGTNVIAGAYLAPYTMNYVPHATGFTGEVHRDAFPGYRAGRIAVSDANDTDSHQFSIISGDFEGIFGIDSDGWIIVTNVAALQATLVPTFVLSVEVTDSGVPPLTATADAIISVAETNALPAAVYREMFKNIGGGATVGDLTSNSKFPGKADELVTLSDFSTPVDVADNYGSRVRAYLVPPANGSYRFYIASDDASQLKLSTTTNPASAAVIAAVSTYSSPGVYNKEAGQISAYRTLVAGQRYYIEALHKEGAGGDHLSVAWTLPGSTETNVIPGAFLEPFDISTAPQFFSQSLGVFESAINGVVIGRLSASDSPLDTLTFQIMGGNTNDTFGINPATGDVLLLDNSLIATGAVTNFSLVVAVQDSGCGGLYPLRTAQATLSINVISTNSPLVWLGAGSTNVWSDPGNWGGIVPYEGARLILGAPSLQSNINDLLSQAAWVRLTNAGFNISGNPLILQSGLTNTGNNTWNIDSTLGAAQAWHNSIGTLTINGSIDTAGFGLGLVAAGDIRLGGTISGAGPIAKSGIGKLLISGSHPVTGVLTVATTGGTATALEVNGPADLDLSGSDLVMNGRMDLWNHNATIGGLNGNGLIFANDSTRRLTVGANDHSGSFAGVLTNSTWAAGATLGLLKTGSGVQTLTGASAYSGGTIVRAGQISPANAAALGVGTVTLGDPETGTNPVTLAATAAVTITNSLVVAAQGSGAATIGTANISPVVNMQYSGPLTLNRDAVLQAGSTDRTTFAGRISGSGGLNIISPFAANRRIVLDRTSGLSNDFSGDVLIGTNAVLQLGVTSSIGNRTVPDTSAINFAPGAQLRFAPSIAGDSETVGALNSGAETAGVLDMVTATPFTLVFGAENGFFSGAISNTVGSLGLRKSGAGTQVIAGAGYFSGLVSVSEGTLVAASDTALGSSSAGTIISPGATLALSNSITIASEVLSITGTGAANSGALRNDVGQNAYAGIIALVGPAKIRAQAGQLTLGPLNLGANLLTLETLNGAGLVVSGAASGSGGLEKIGPGALTLESPNLHTGPTLISEGVVTLAAASGISNSSLITVQSVLDVSAFTNGWALAAGQVLSGDGTVVGTVTGPGTVNPGTSIGKLMIQGDATLAGTTVMEISRSGPVLTNDLLTVTATLTPGGVLVVTNVGPDAPVPGDSFTLFAAGSIAAGTFTSVELPQISGIAWDTSRLNTEGILVALLGEPSQPPSLSLSASNGNLTLSWPADYTSYILQAQTNNQGEGLTPSWFPVQGVTTNTFTIPIDSTAGSVFYRLLKQ